MWIIITKEAICIGDFWENSSSAVGSQSQAQVFSPGNFVVVAQGEEAAPLPSTPNMQAIASEISVMVRARLQVTVNRPHVDSLRKIENALGANAELVDDDEADWERHSLFNDALAVYVAAGMGVNV